MEVYLTPHKVSILILMQQYIESTILPPKVKYGLAQFLLTEITTVKDFTERPLQDLLKDLEFSESVRDNLVNKLNFLLFGAPNEDPPAIGSPDQIYNFFTETAQLLEEDSPGSSNLGPSSPMGIFIRRMVLGFRSMMFDGLARLWEELCRYVDIEEDCFRGILSPFESENFVNAEAENIEKSFGKMTQLEIEDKIEKLKYIAPNLPKAHFLSYLNYVTHGEFEQAVESLHRYFDYSVEAAHKEALLTATPQTKTKPPNLLPYATLNLAGLHFRYGHISQGIQLIHETVRIAQERNDDQCLALALSWLFRLISGDTGDHHQEYQILKRCVARSAELNLPYLSSQSTMALANHYLLHPRDQPHVVQRGGESNVKTRPRKVWELLKISMRTNIKDGVLHNLTSAAHLLRANCWELFGNMDLARLSAQLQLANCQAEADPSDNAQAMCKVAWQYSMLGEFQTALHVLMEAKKLFPLPPSRVVWQKITLQILLEWALRRGQQKIAANLLLHYDAICSCSHMDIHAKIDTRYRNALLTMHKRNYMEATNELNLLIHFCLDWGLEIQTVSLRLTLAEVHNLAGCHGEALPYVLSCLTLSEQYHLDTLNAMAKILLADIQLNLNEPPKKIVTLVTSTLPLVLQHCHIETGANAHLVLAKANIAQGPEHFKDALHQLELATEGMKKVESLTKLEEIYYLQARIYHHLEDYTKRNASAEKFMETQNQRVVASQYWSESYYGLCLKDIVTM